MLGFSIPSHFIQFQHRSSGHREAHRAPGTTQPDRKGARGAVFWLSGVILTCGGRDVLHIQGRVKL